MGHALPMRCIDPSPLVFFPCLLPLYALFCCRCCVDVAGWIAAAATNRSCALLCCTTHATSNDNKQPHIQQAHTKETKE